MAAEQSFAAANPMSRAGTPRHFTAMHCFGRFRSEADMDWQAKATKAVENDPTRTSGGQNAVPHNAPPAP
jgi:hypothetical protein